jgi:hypothetical protein
MWSNWISRHSLLDFLLAEIKGDVPSVGYVNIAIVSKVSLLRIQQLHERNHKGMIPAHSQK